MATIRSELFIFRESVYHDIFDVDVNPHAKPDDSWGVATGKMFTRGVFSAA